MSKIVKISRPDYNNFNILAFITNSCNYNCWYCYVKKEKTAFLNLLSLYNYVQFVRSSTDRHIDLDLIGGEPTTHEDLIDFCRDMDKVDELTTTIYTNFSKPVEYLRELTKYNVKFEATYHYRDNSDFVNKVLQFDIDDFRVITVMYEREHYIESLKVYDKLRNEGYQVDLQPVIIGSSKEEWDDVQLDEFYKRELREKPYFQAVFDDNTTLMITHNMIDEYTHSNFKYWQCSAGKDLVYIHNDGNLYVCDGYYNFNLPSVYNINDGNYKMIEKCQYCKVDNCPFEDNLTKTKIFR